MGDGNCNQVGRFTEAPVGDSKFEELSKASAPFLQNPCLISLLGACSPPDSPGIWVILLSQPEGMGDVREGLEALGLAPRGSASEPVPSRSCNKTCQH